MDIQQFINMTLESWADFGLWLVGLFVVFSILSKISPCNPGQPLVRPDALTDVLYGFVIPLFTRFVRIAYLATGMYILFLGAPPKDILSYIENGFGPVAALPLWLQSAIVFVVSDFLLYWAHRWFHTAKMWKFHAIHHSTKQLDWLSTFRFHPINTWLSFTLVDTIMLLAGFSFASITLMASFNMAYSAMVHANLNWAFGPFRYIFASPVFHRWHHTAQEEGMDKNFAPTFPLLDLAFGTFYMPEGKLPEIYGVPGSDIPDGFAGQILWPLRK